MKTRYVKLLLLPLSLLLAVAAHADVLVVTSAASPLSSLSSDQIQQVFTGKLHEIQGQALTPLDLPEDNATRSDFYKQVTGRDTRQMRAYWTQLIFTGRGAPPRTVTQSDLLSKLKANANFVGYLPASADISGLKVLAKLP
jgi:hypothetical protein